MKFCYDTSFTLPKTPKDLDPSYKTDLNLWDCFGRKENPSYNHSTAVSIGNDRCDKKSSSTFLFDEKILIGRCTFIESYKQKVRGIYF